MSRPRRPAIPKLTRPRLLGILTRERLSRQLASATPVAWITAAPGSGKTTLAASYSETAAGKTLWYQVDSGDADPATFFHYVRELAATLSSRAAKLPSLPAEGAVDLAVFGRSFFRSFFALLPAKTIWVVDNFQEADGVWLGSILREAFLQIPGDLSVIVLSLVDPPPVLARLVANGTIRSIASTELRFTRQESDALVLSKVVADERLLAGIHDRSSGWAAGLVMMIEHMRRAGTPELPSLEESQAAVFDYFAEEILAACSADEQRTLMLTASLPRVTTRLAEAMSGRPDAGALFERLHRHHLFVDRRGTAEPSYQYHGLFRTYLGARASALPSRERADAAGRAAATLEADDHPEEAITMHLVASNWDAAARLLIQHARRLHDQGRWRTLLEWISSLPTAWLDDRPSLLYWQGACQLWSAPSDARQILERAYRRFEELDDQTGRVLTAGALTRACILDTNWSVLDRWIAELSALLSSSTASVPDEVLLVGFSRLLYVAFARQPNHPQLGQWAERTRDLLGKTSEPTERVFAGATAWSSSSPGPGSTPGARTSSARSRP